MEQEREPRAELRRLVRTREELVEQMRVRRQVGEV
jgi:hypothetical protein